MVYIIVDIMALMAFYGVHFSSLINFHSIAKAITTHNYTWSASVGLLFHPGIIFEITRQNIDPDSHVIVNLNNQSFQVINIHMPTNHSSWETFSATCSVLCFVMLTQLWLVIQE